MVFGLWFLVFDFISNQKPKTKDQKPKYL